MPLPRTAPAAFLVLALALASQLEAQEREVGPEGSSVLERTSLTISLGGPLDLPEPFTVSLCPQFRPTSLDLRARFQLTRHFFVAGSGERVAEPRDECVSVVAPPPPVPPEGPFVRPFRRYPDGIAAFPHTVWGTRLGAVLRDEDYGVVAGVTGGLSWIPSKDLRGPVAGLHAAVDIPRLPVALAALVDWHRYDVPLRVGEAHFMDGQLVSTTEVEVPVRSQFWVVRLGFQIGG